MDQALEKAAESGDVEFLRRVVASQQPPDYFLTLNGKQNNIFNIAAINERVEWMRVGLEIIPISIQQKLQILSQGNNFNRNPLHYAVFKLKLSSASMEMVNIILDFYKLHSDQSIIKPWLSLDNEKKTPLHLALLYGYEESAMEIMSMDMELLCRMEDKWENSPIFLAVKNSCNKVAENILTSSFFYSRSSVDGSTPLHYAPNSSEYVLRLLLEKHPEQVDVVDRYGYTILHQWVETMKEVWPLDILLKGEFPAVSTKVFTDFIYRTAGEKKSNETPLHVAARNKNSEIVKAIINGYQKEIKAVGDSNDRSPPWKTKNSYGNTPLQIALFNRNEELALYMLSLDPTLYQILNNKNESPLFNAARTGCGNFVEEILSNYHINLSMMRAIDGSTVLHNLPYIPENIGKRLLEEYWWMIDFANIDGKTAQHVARTRNVPWLINLVMKPSLIQRKSFDWISKFEQDETNFVLEFIDNYKNLRAVCRELNDTPLHHIKLQTYEDYLHLLKKSSIAELKNTIDYEGATPLHRALERKDIHFVKALLNDGVEHNIQDHNGKTAMDLLAELREENNDWDMMCKQMNIITGLNTAYINPETNLDQMRNTLSVVAALLATITFAAGFTLPGGLNNDSGNAILAKKPAFLVFLLADAYAMCTSMLVLFCLIWSMVSNRDMSYLLVDRSVLILMQALQGTMLAFMTGIYSMISHNSLWATIIIIVMCSVIGISASSRTILHNFLANVLPTANKDQRERARWFKKRKSYTSSGNEDNQAADDTSREPPHNSVSFERRNNAIPTKNQDHEDHIRLLEEGHAFSLRNDDTKGEGTSNNQLQKLGPENSTSSVYKPSPSSQLSISVEQSQQQMSEQMVEFERQRVEFERQRVEFKRQRVEFERQRAQWERQRLDLETERHEREKERGGSKKVN